MKIFFLKKSELRIGLYYVVDEGFFNYFNFKTLKIEKFDLWISHHDYYCDSRRNAIRILKRINGKNIRIIE